MGSKFDPFKEYDAATLKARGPKVLRELLDAIDARAEHDEETLADAASRLPPAWQATVLIAHIVRGLEEGRQIPEVMQDFAEVDDRTLIISSLKQIGEKSLAGELQRAEEVLDEDEKDWSGFGAPDADELGRIKKKLFVLVGTMDQPFPPR
jgi:hypothetical protein